MKGGDISVFICGQFISGLDSVLISFSRINIEMLNWQQNNCYFNIEPKHFVHPFQIFLVLHLPKSIGLFSMYKMHFFDVSRFIHALRHLFMVKYILQKRFFFYQSSHSIATTLCAKSSFRMKLIIGSLILWH